VKDQDGTLTGMDLWVEERFHDVAAARFRVRRVLFAGQSEFQHVEVVETAAHGRMLLNDGMVMLSERDESVYHEMIVHVPLFVHPEPRRVLVVGGGDGGTVREVLRHRSVEHCRLVEIDGMVIDACREHIPQVAAALDDPRCEVTVADGVAFVHETDETYDVVLIDSTDPVGPAAPLFGDAFYASVERVLTDRGIVVSQAETPHYAPAAQLSLLQLLAARFPVTALYNYTNLTYPGGLWSFSFASRGPRPVSDLDEARIGAAGLEMQYYSPAVHRAAFALPEFQRRPVADHLREL